MEVCGTYSHFYTEKKPAVEVCLSIEYVHYDLKDSAKHRMDRERRARSLNIKLSQICSDDV